jgi:hypothetical protein
MQPAVVVLEDDEDRTAAMRRLLTRDYPRYPVRFFDNAPDLIDWLRQPGVRLALLCLDHDLGPNRRRDGEVFDPGTGRDVVDYLLTWEPACPVIVHSSNGPAAVGMRQALKEAGWVHARVVPLNDLEWVDLAWRAKVRKYLGTPAATTGQGTDPPGGLPTAPENG